MPGLRFVNPPQLNKPPTYTHVVEVTGPARVLYLAGQLGTDKDGKLVGADFEAQAVQVFENLKIALESVGADFSHVVKFTNYLTRIEDIPSLREVRARYLTSPDKPASTLLHISGLAVPGALLEIEAIAAVPA